ncbi:Protein jagged-1b [Takifugu flavidus]|uniref:Protein jagged-1b n=1 Tax=Takifugu flavidus TaxID=433684 RepID=A0A5C6NZF5_9TELE|nr:Protein jagged-1b [Takifugu flavidus]
MCVCTCFPERKHLLQSVRSHLSQAAARGPQERTPQPADLEEQLPQRTVPRPPSDTQPDHQMKAWRSSERRRQSGRAAERSGTERVLLNFHICALHRWSPAAADMRDIVQRARRFSLVCLLLALQAEVSRSTGYFELQLVSVENPGGQLLSGDCCDAERSAAEGPCGADECDTYFKVCLKEYQTEVVTRGTCTYGSETTKVIGGNTFQFKSGQKSGGNRNEAGKILIRFQFAWPVEYHLPIGCVGMWAGLNSARSTSLRLCVVDAVGGGERKETAWGGSGSSERHRYLLIFGRFWFRSGPTRRPESAPRVSLGIGCCRSSTTTEI